MQPAHSKFETSRFGAPAARPAEPTPVPRVLGVFVSLTYLDRGTPRRRKAQHGNPLVVDPRGRLLICEDHLPTNCRVTEIEYQTVDDRFGEGTMGKIAFHAFGEETGDLPHLLRSTYGCGYELAGGSYRVGPEGIRN